VRSVKGYVIADGSVPAHRRLTDAFIQLPDCDLGGQDL
jgi:hypothetical protein